MGCLCFRFIRPGHNDGYHLCKKSWGDAKKVLSAWLPVFGFEQSQMIQLLPGSHKKKIPFLSISKTIMTILNDRNYKKYAIRKPKNINQVQIIDNWAREFAKRKNA